MPADGVIHLAGRAVQGDLHVDVIAAGQLAGYLRSYLQAVGGELHADVVRGGVVGPAGRRLPLTRGSGQPRTLRNALRALAKLGSCIAHSLDHTRAWCQIASKPSAGRDTRPNAAYTSELGALSRIPMPYDPRFATFHATSRKSSVYSKSRTPTATSCASWIFTLKG